MKNLLKRLWPFRLKQPVLESRARFEDFEPMFAEADRASKRAMREELAFAYETIEALEQEITELRATNKRLEQPNEQS